MHDLKSFPGNVEPIAIVGLSCRFPAEASSPSGLWEMMSNSRSGHSKIPSDRFNADAWYHPNHDRRGTINVKHGFFLDDVSRFDAPFFSLTAKEAAGMDPMQRLLLEVSYEAFENAGLPINRLPGSSTSVYCGCFTGDYDLLSNHDILNHAPNAATGTGRAMLSNRISWFYDLHGPSFTVDTACSSSLYALHLACQSLRLGESTQALVTGSNLVLYPSMMHSLTNMHFLSPDGLCHTFDDRANGYARGEAIGAILLKPLADALRDHDTIRAVVRGSGANQDGKTPGITMPSGDAQADLIRATYAQAGLSLADTGYFEAHGTGTALGDPTELSAIGKTFGAVRRPSQPPLYVGSIKSNIGHTEGCSGLAGVIKAVMCLEKGLIPPNAGLRNPNPKLRLEEWRLALPTSTMPWPPSSGPRRVSVNSFGYGGANAHVILDDAHHYLHSRGLDGHHATLADDDSGSDSGISIDPLPPQPITSVASLTPTVGAPTGGIPLTKKLFVFSSMDQQGLQRIASSYREMLVGFLNKHRKIPGYQEDPTTIGYHSDLAYTLASRRTQFDYRSFAVAGTVAELTESLGRGLPKIKKASKHDNIMLVFTGQGAQWASMGIQLLSNPIFHDSMTRTQSYLELLGCPWDILTELARPDSESRIDSPEFSQPLCTALQVALVDLLQHWKVNVKATVGHSSGEIGAAYAAGYLSHSDAIKVAYFRGIYSKDIIRRLGGRRGAMMAVGLSPEEANSYLKQIPANTAVVSCVNSPSSVTISGDESSVDHLESLLKKDDKFARKLRVQTAYHSHHMAAVSDDYLASLADVQPLAGNKGTIMISSVTGDLVCSHQLDAQYWVQNMVQPVRFAHAVKGILSYTPPTARRRKTLIPWSAVIEVGPHPALKGPVNQIMNAFDAKLASSVTYTTLLIRNKSADATALEAAGQLWAAGHEIDKARVNDLDEESCRSLVTLPPYSWNHTRGFWHEPRMTTAKRFKNEPRTDLLGKSLDNQNDLEPQWRNVLRIPESPWMSQHEITGTVLYPGAGILIMAIEAALQIADQSRQLKGIELTDVTFDRGLVIPAADEAVETLLSFRPHRTILDCYNWALFSIPPSGIWTEHSTGMVSIVYEPSQVHDGNDDSKDEEWQLQTSKYKDIIRRATKRVSHDEFYRDLAAIGMGYGPLFTNLHNAAAVPGENCGHGRVYISDTRSSMPHEFEYPHLIHPTTLDAIFHLLFVGFTGGETLREAAVPVAMEKMFISSQKLPSGSGSCYLGYTEAASIGTREFSGNLVMSDADWSGPKIVISNFVAQEVSSGASANKSTAMTPLSNGTADPYKRCAHLVWREDVEFLDRPVAQELFRRESDGFISDALATWTDRVVHKDADINALLIVKISTMAAVKNLSAQYAPHDGNGRFRFKKCTVASPSPAVLEDIKQSLSSDVRVTYSDLDDILQQKEVFDFIIADTEFRLSELPLETVLATLKEKLFPGNQLVLTGPQPETLHAGERLLVNAGFDRIHAVVEDDNTNTVMLASSSSIHETRQSDYGEIVLLLPSSDDGSPALSSLQRNLGQYFATQGLRVKSALMSETDAVRGKAIISLVEAEQPLIIKWTEADLEAFKQVVASAPYLLWVTRGAQMIDSDQVSFAPTTGMLRTVRTEVPQICLPSLDLAPNVDLTDESTTQTVSRIFYRTTHSQHKMHEMEYVVTHGRVLIPRAEEDTSFDFDLELSSGHARCTFAPLHQEGRILKLEASPAVFGGEARWVDDQEALSPLASNEVEIDTVAIAFNPADAATLNRLPVDGNREIGLGATGRVSRVGKDASNFSIGQYVAVFKPGVARTRIRQHQSLVQACPGPLGLSGIASITPGITAAYHALVEIARVEKGEVVLVHDALSSLGQAAMQIASYHGARVFATVNNAAQKKTVVSTFGLQTAHVYDTHAICDLASAIRRATNGQGADVILLSSESGRVIHQLSTCVADGARFVSVDQATNASALASTFFKSHASTIPMDMARIATTKRAAVSRSMQAAFDLLRSGHIGPHVTPNVLSVSELDMAIRDTTSRELSGSTVLTFDRLSNVRQVPIRPPALRLDTEATYILSGGLGGLGPSLAKTMVAAGARHIVFLGRSGASTPEHKMLLESLSAQGCRAEAYRCDISKTSHVESLVHMGTEQGWKIKGLVQCAMVLRDSVLENMTYDKWVGATQPKIAGTWNLHSFLPKNLDFFIMLSSVVSVIGNAGQANYAAGNSYLDALAHLRRQQGQSATSLNVGLVVDATHFTEDFTIHDFLSLYNHLVPVQVENRELNVVLEAAMRGTTADGTPVPTQVIVGISDQLPRGSATQMTSQWSLDRKFDHRAREVSDQKGDGALSQERLSDTLAAAISIQDAVDAVELAFRVNIASTMGSTAEDINPEKPLHSMGVDSLKAVEVRNWVFREIKADVSVFEILSPMPIADLARKVAAKSNYISAQVSKQVADEAE